MVSEAEIAEQIELEREAIRVGRLRLHQNTQKLEDKEYASASVYGVSTIESLLPALVARIEANYHRIKQGHAGKAFKNIAEAMKHCDADVMAAITLKITIDQVFSRKPRSNEIQNIIIGIGTAVENECMITFYERTCPGLLKTIKENYWHASSGTYTKVKALKVLLNRKEIDHWIRWSPEQRARLGGFLLDEFCLVSDWFVRDLRVNGKKTKQVLIPSPHFETIKAKIMADAELFSPMLWPMLVPPKDWTPNDKGGYLLNAVMEGHPMVRRGDPSLKQGEKVYAFLNKIQKVGFRISPFVLDVAKQLEERKVQVGKFIPLCDVVLPNKPVDIETNKESRQAYRRAAAEAYNLQAQMYNKSCRTRMIMNLARKFEGRTFYHPFSADYRGRVYPIAPYLTPQCTDFGKSLLEFAEESPMTDAAEQWLAFAVSTHYGNDKMDMINRLSWTYENEDLVTAVATDPIEHIGIWEAAADPWCFLHACHEYYHTCIIQDKLTTNYPVACDATASGLQVLSGLARDASTARLVNVSPSKEPQDAYKVIAEESLHAIPDHIKPIWDRKCTKRSALTIPYNAKPFSNRQYIRDALKEKGIEIEPEELTIIVAAVRGAMEKIFPGPMSVMRWIEQEVAKAFKRGESQLTWTTPTGFVVTQKLNKWHLKRIDMQLLGRCQMLIATDESPKVDVLHHKNATAPNLIHSLDSSLLCLATLKFNAPLALIHDSVLCRATDMDQLSTHLRQAYMHLFAEHDYLTDFARMIGAETEPPMINTLKPESVINSTYFFC